MAASRKSPCRKPSCRPLRVEPLEDRRLLSAGWFGGVVHDGSGDLFAVDLDGGMAIEHLGTMDRVMFDVAFSPSGELFGIGGSLSGPSRLYSIDVDFENPSPVIQTQLLGTLLVADEHPIYVNALDFRPDGTLFAAGYDLSGGRYVYSIDTSTAEANEELSIGGHGSAGDLTFDVDGNMYLTTSAAELLRVDQGLSRVDVVGPIGFVDLYGLAYGPGPVMHGFRQARQVYRIHPDDARTTQVAALSHRRLDLVYGAAAVYRPPVDLGQVDFLELPAQKPVLGELWYKLEPMHDAYLTAEVPGADSEAHVDLTLYRQDDAGDLHRLESGRLRFDYEWAAAGEQYFLKIEGLESSADVRLTNLVSTVETGATVYGTAQSDTFEFTAGRPYVFSINGTGYQFGFAPGEDVWMSFSAGAGHDVARLIGSDENEAATLSLASHSGNLSGPGYTVDVSGTPEIHIDGGPGDDTATLFDSPGNETFRSTPDGASLAGTGTLHEVGHFETVEAYATAGGDDLAILRDSDGDDTFIGRPELGRLSGDGFFVRARSFDTVVAVAKAGGNDTAYLFDSPGNDTLVARPTYAKLFGGGFRNLAKFFEDVDVRAGAGGTDVARLYDSGGNDVFDATPRQSTLSGPGFMNRAVRFAQVDAYSTSGGFDKAYLHDSPGDDVFVGKPTIGKLSGPRFRNRARCFDAVFAIADGGGRDTAYLIDSPGDDIFVGRPTRAKLQGPGFFNRAEFFEEVYARASSGGYDRAFLFDSPEVDSLQAAGNHAQLANTHLDFLYWVAAFDYVKAISTSPGDVKDVDPVDFTLVLKGF